MQPTGGHREQRKVGRLVGKPSVNPRSTLLSDGWLWWDEEINRPALPPCAHQLSKYQVINDSACVDADISVANDQQHALASRSIKHQQAAERASTPMSVESAQHTQAHVAGGWHLLRLPTTARQSQQTRFRAGEGVGRRRRSGLQQRHYKNAVPSGVHNPCNSS